MWMDDLGDSRQYADRVVRHMTKSSPDHHTTEILLAQVIDE